MIYLLQSPPKPGRVSGAYRCNHELGRRLQAAEAGRIVNVEAAELRERCAELSRADPEAVLVFDSLFLHQVDPRFLGSALLRATKTILLLHYLPSRNPRLDPEERLRLERAEQSWILASDAVISAGSKLARELAERHKGLPIRVVHPGVDPCFTSLGGPARFDAGKALSLVSVAHLIPDKGHRSLVEICERLAKEGHALKLVLIGDESLDSEYTQSLRAAAQSFELELTGTLSIEEVAKRLEQAQVFVSASSYENFATSCVEAAAAGVPVLAYELGDVGYWVRDGENGLLVAPGDREGLEAALRGFCEEPGKLESLQRGPAREAFPSWEGSFEDFLTSCEAVRLGLGAGPTGEVSFYSRCQLPTGLGSFEVEVYKVGGGEEEAVLISMGELDASEPPFVRVHSECFTGEVLDSLKCDCRDQLIAALRTIAQKGRGAVVYLRQEGRGIGLGNKIRAYAEQERGANTVEANTILGFPIDLRDFSQAAAILRLKGARRVHMNTNNPAKVASLQENGIVVESVLSSTSQPNRHNLDYLRTKYRLLGHAGLGPVLPANEEDADHGPESLFARIVSGTQKEPADPREEGGRRLVLFDLDGVIPFGERVPPEAIELIQRCREAGIALRFLSNDGVGSRRSRLASLREAGLALADDELYTSSYLAARYAQEQGLLPVLPLLGEPAIEDLHGLVTEDAEVAKSVLVGDWFHFYDRDRLVQAQRALEAGATLLAMHKKRHWPGPEGRTIDLGFWVAGLEYCAGQPATVIGKPSSYAYETVLRDAGFRAEDCLMVADEVHPDLMGADRLGIATLLFRTDGVEPCSSTLPVLDSFESLWDEIRLPR
ncbi:MAG: hypothetical protein CSA65_00035 [Proteobacteria bacterium]|nr:MAG: hypothetical protein CSA65_00035 [Pseudomonadota bacterium]